MKIHRATWSKRDKEKKMEVKILNGKFYRGEIKSNASFVEKGVVDLEKQEYSPGVFADLVRAIAEIKCVGLGYRVNGHKFIGKLVGAAIGYVAYLHKQDENGGKKYHPDGVHELAEYDPMLCTNERKAPYAVIAMCAAHEARAIIGYDMPSFITVDDIRWVPDYFGKVSHANLQQMADEAEKQAKAAYEIGNLRIEAGETVGKALFRYKTELYTAMKERAIVKANIARENSLEIAEVMCDPVFETSAKCFKTMGFSSCDPEILQEKIDENVGSHVASLCQILKHAYANAEKATRSYSASRAREGMEALKIIKEVQSYALTEKEMETQEERRKEAEEAFKNSKFEL